MLQVYLYIFVGEDYEGFPVILRKDLSPSQLSLILTEHSIYILLLVYYSLKMSYNK